MSKIGVELQRIRLKRGLTQGDVAQKIGRSKNRISIIESSSAPEPTISVIKALCEVYDIPFEALIVLSSLPSSNKKYEGYRTILVDAIIRNFDL